VLLTSHGGWTYHQNFGALGDSYVLSAVRDDPAAKNILSTARALADDRSSHAFHSDLLKQLGVIAVWPLLWGKGPIVNHSWTEPAPAWISQFSGLYTIGKAIPHEVAPPRAHADLQAALLRHDPLSAQLDVAKYLCLHSVFCYQGAQGAAVELLVDLAMLRIDSGQKTDLLWHTHFGTANLDPTLKPSPRTVLHPAIGRGMLRLARHHYGVDGAIGLDRRVWVPAAGVLVRYRTMMAHAPKRVRIESGSRVIVDPWIDPVTGQRIPAAAAGTRDLHGLTVYVEDPGAATVEVGRESIRTFTRNPADQTGRPSITIVDNNTPTVMLDEVETGVLGKVEVRGGELAEPASKSDALYGRRFYRLRATAPTASVELTPHQLELWNVSHLHFGYRKHAASGVLAQGKLFIELELESGNRFEIVEAGGDANAGAAGGWTIDALTASGAWRYVTLDTAQMAARMPDGDARGAPPVPIGTVKKLRFGMRGAAPGETLDLDGLAALRANSNGEAQDASKLVAGQITYADGSPVANVAVRAISSSGHRHSTRTDQHGYYFFPRVARGSILEIVANVNGKRCIPVRGRLIDIRKNEAEIDINLAACGVEPSQRTRISAP
jgi:hypothetical protein